jgi:hypothetical protein
VDHQLVWSVVVYHRDHLDVPLLERSYTFDDKLVSGAYYNPSPARALVVKGLDQTVRQAATDISEAIADGQAARAAAAPKPASPEHPATPEAAEPSPEPGGVEPQAPPMGDPFRAR